MSGTHAPAQGRQSSGSSKQKARKPQRSARTPEPKEIISGAGHPLDPGIRRELEARLGHDFSRVRVHTDEDSAALADLVGADAVTVGQEIFFRAGTFRPGTEDGRRLLAHELLHTVQAPDQPGRLRAGRDFGGVSLPTDAVEQQAEQGARSADGGRTEVTRDSSATPGWLRYARVDADRLRSERLDPATLVDRLTAGILRSLRGDPTDSSGRVRKQLIRFAPELEQAVLAKLELRLPSSDYQRVLDLAEQASDVPEGMDTPLTPVPVTDTVDRIEAEHDQDDVRERDHREAEQGPRDDSPEGRRQHEQEHEERYPQQRVHQAELKRRRPSKQRGRGERNAQGPEGTSSSSGAGGDASVSSASSASSASDGATNGQSASARPGAAIGDQAQADQPGQDQAQGATAGQQQADGQDAQDKNRKDQQAQQDQQQKTEQSKDTKDKPAAAKAEGSPEHERKSATKQPVAGSKPHNPDHLPTPQPGPVRPEEVDKTAEQRDGSLVRHGVLEGDEESGEPPEQEQPEGLEPGADNEIGGPQGAEKPGATGGAEATLKPEDFLPSTDLDVSAVSTADQIHLSAGGSAPASAEVPSFPAPPPTKAEKVQAARESEREDDEPAEPPIATAPPAPGRRTPQSVPQPGPVAENAAGDRTEHDLQTEKPVEQEVGPDPEQAQPADDGSAAAEPEAEAHPQAGGQTDVASAERPQTEGGTAPSPAQQESAAEHNERQEAEHAPAPAAPTSARVAARPSAAQHAQQPAGVSPGSGSAAGATPGRAPAPAAAAGPVGAPEPTGAIARPGAAPGGVGPARAAAQSPALGPADQQSDAPGALGAQPAPGASLEPGGGACAGSPEPSTEADKPEGGGGCGGGGGGAQEQKSPAPPNVSDQDPQAALGTAAAVPADQTVTVLNGADGAVDHSIGQQQAQLQAAPPTTQRPSGAPQTLQGKPTEEAPAPQVSGQLERVAPPGQGQQQKADGNQVQGQNPAEQVQTPNVPATDAGKADAHDVQNMQDAVNDVPSTDPGLNVTVGPAPQVQLTGDADPKLTDQQAGKYNDKTSEIQNTGRQDAAKPLGEDQIYPDVPKETLKGNVPGGVGGQGGGGKAGTQLKPGEATVVQQQRGPQIKQAIGQGQGQVGSAQADNEQQQAEARKKNQSDIDKETADNARKQTDKRGEVGVQAKQARDQWRSEQDQKVADSDKQADQSHTENNQKILSKRDDSNKQVKDRQTSDNKKIQDNRDQAQKKAQDEKEKKKHESSGWFGWITSKIKDAFNALLSAVTKIFDFFRKLVNDIIDGFKKFADSVIDTCRKLAVELIKAVADTLIQICDVLLAAFPALRDKFRRAIEDLRDAAIAAVNALADTLKAAVNALLDALGAALNALLKLAEATLKAIINQVRSMVEAAINFVKAAIAALGQLAALIADIAPDPGGWLSKMGAAARDGIQHHLWGAVKTAVKAWFDQKVESVVGLTSTLLNILIKGCISLKKIGQMAWKAIISALPMMLAQIIIEKVISMIVPAAGAIMTIIQGLMAAWGTISKIIAAFGKFFAFLKAVKAGPAACLFAEAVAAGVVALLEFVSQYLLSKLKGAGKAVGTKLKALAQKILKALAKAGKGARKAVGTAVNRARTGLRNAMSSLRERFPSRRPTESAFGEHPHERPGDPHVSPRHPEEERPKAHRPEETSPQTHHPEEHSTETKRPGEHDDPRSTKPHEQDPKPHEPEKPKEPSRPRRPVSRVGRVLNRAKGAVKGALAKARNAARVLGRKLKNSKLGRAIRNGAHKVYDFYKRKRDQLRDWWKKRKEQRKQNREDRHKKENSPAAKEERLTLIVARIRAVLQRMLTSGVRGPVLRGTLAMMRMWYRLTQLNMSGGEQFLVNAVLNPGTVVIQGATVGEEELLSFIRQVADEILDAPSTRRGAASIEANRTEDKRVLNKNGDTANLPTYRLGRGVSMASMLRYVVDRIPFKKGAKEVIALPGGQEVWRQQSPWRPVRGLAHEVNKFVYEMNGGAKQSNPPRYQDIVKLINADGRGGNFRARLLAKQVQRALRGRPVHGPGADRAAFLAVLMAVQEGHRDPGRAPLVTAAMSMQIMARTGDAEAALGGFPPEPTGSQRGMFRLSDYLDRVNRGQARLDPDNEPIGPAGEAAELRQLSRRAQNLRGIAAERRGSAETPDARKAMADRVRQAEELHRVTNRRAEHMSVADQVMRREVQIIKLWAATLDLKVTASEEEGKKRELFRMIRQRMHQAYGISAGETARIQQQADGGQ
ncbi:eCIS core domain-containing protein [Streptomyces sp. NPDC003233]